MNSVLHIVNTLPPFIVEVLVDTGKIYRRRLPAVFLRLRLRLRSRLCLGRLSCTSTGCLRTRRRRRWRRGDSGCRLAKILLLRRCLRALVARRLYS